MNNRRERSLSDSASMLGRHQSARIWSRSAAVSGIILFVWICLVAILGFVDVFIVPFQIPDSTPLMQTVLSVVKVAVSGALLGVWFCFWHWLVSRYYQESLDKIFRSN